MSGAATDAAGLVARLQARGMAPRPFEASAAARAALGTTCPSHAIEPAHAEQLREIVIEANVADEPLLPVGGATALSAGRPLARRGMAVAMGGLARIVDHSVADFVVTVEAGCRFAALQAELLKHRQWLAVEPPDREQATVGGMVAAAATSFVAAQHGTLRHHLLGVRVLHADGHFAKAGGRVVKNVAGYDLMKMHHGALGTLGIVVAATFRLRPLPAADLVTTAPCDDAETMAAFGDALARPGLAAAAGWFLGHLRAGALQGQLLARFQGARATVVDQATAIEAAPSGPRMAWRREVVEADGARPRPLQLLAEMGSCAQDGDAALLTLHFAPSRTRDVAAALMRFGAGRIALDLVRGFGLLKLATDGGEGALTRSLAHGLAALKGELAAAGAALFSQAGPTPLRALAPSSSLTPEGEKMAAALRDELDPQRRINPGRWGA